MNPKPIHTRLFKLDGTWEMGLQGLTNEERKQLTGLRRLRYNPTLRVWHIPYQKDTLEQLNQLFGESFLFIADKHPTDLAPDIKSKEIPCHIYLLTSPGKDLLLLRHTYNRELYRQLSKMEGAVFDKDLKGWYLSYSDHYEKVLQIAHERQIPVTHLEEEPPEQSGGAKIADKLREGLDLFRQNLVLRNMSHRTIEAYLHSLDKFFDHFSGRNPQEISSEEIRRYLFELHSKKAYAFSTLNVLISAIKSFYLHVFHIELTMIDLPRPKKEKRLPKYLSEEQIKQMINCTPNLKQRTMITLLYSTAIRRDEILNLKLTEMNLESGEILIHGKGKKDRIVYISGSLRKILDRYLLAYRPSEYLFEGRSGRYSPTSISKVISNAAKKARIEQNVSPHMLRHSYATHMLRKGISIAYIQKLLGHADIKTTLIYTGITDQDLRNLPNPLDDLNIL